MAIVARREKLGLTPEEIAERLGVTADTYRQWENGRRAPHMDALRGLAEALEMSIRRLLPAE